MFRRFAVIRRKDNIKGEQELSTPFLFNLKSAKNFCLAIGIAAFRSRHWLDLQKPGGGMIFSNVRKELPGA